MAKTGLKFKALSPDYEEDMTMKMSPKKLVMTLAMGKAQSIAKQHPGAIIISADTIVVLGKEVMGKPKSKQQGATMLRKLSGTKHSILTGLAIIQSGGRKQFLALSETLVYFKKLSLADINGYIATGEPMDKAGAYAIHELGGILISKVEGNYSGAIGLPIAELAQGLKKFGINIFKKS